ncbi:protein transport protein SEC31-like [Vulpes lagopus]|uniref:protein transport protein SEC31-like n=1 Tax=Vulpes lagopus TaxID=494514 RepID=UPI001BCA5FC8|nr:protein transport protein SEC31-like [Vulpes lagopus]
MFKALHWGPPNPKVSPGKKVTPVFISKGSGNEKEPKQVAQGKVCREGWKGAAPSGTHPSLPTWVSRGRPTQDGGPSPYSPRRQVHHCCGGPWSLQSVQDEPGCARPRTPGQSQRPVTEAQRTQAAWRSLRPEVVPPAGDGGAACGRLSMPRAACASAGLPPAGAPGAAARKVQAGAPSATSSEWVTACAPLPQPSSGSPAGGRLPPLPRGPSPSSTPPQRAVTARPLLQPLQLVPALCPRRPPWLLEFQGKGVGQRASERAIRAVAW